jgi:hypothetical protein
MFEGKNHMHAMTTAFGALGGFAAAPEWWTDASQGALVQLAALTVLVFQGGGGLDWAYSLAVAVVFTILVKMSSSMQAASPSVSLTVTPAAAPVAPPAEENPAAPTEYYHNY